MAKNKSKINLTDLSKDELIERHDETKIRLQKTRFNHAVAVLDNPVTIKNLRRDIARLKTELRAREIAESK